MNGMDHSSGGPGSEGQGVRLVHDEDRDRYEALEGETVVAVLYYEEDQQSAPGTDAGPGTAPGVRDLRSTVVAPSHNGRGLGSALVRFALEDARAGGLRVRPTCWFVEGWIDRHDEFADLLALPRAGTPQDEQGEGTASATGEERP